MAFLLVLVRRMKNMSESLLSICVQMLFITISLLFVIMIGGEFASLTNTPNHNFSIYA